MSSTRGACANALRASSRFAIPASASRRCFAAATTAIARSSFRPASYATVIRSCGGLAVRRCYSSTREPERHETSETGSKLWTFEQMKRLAEDPEKVVIVDAREAAELEETGRIPTAVNIPVVTSPHSFHMTDEDFEDRFGFARPPKETELVFYCKAGVRSRALATLARDAGWTEVGEYPGSWLDWVSNGGEVERQGHRTRGSSD
ncbi:Thiosulfate sulfurtransferase RDL2 [Colletotrichum trifolii]|uniref:Thiosulfate sulfurtransferase RDL2 n=1 Tax=Colletotrichum trifolii TaxID=5466 RepID=A0A4R8RJ44_COLTR|nr:Thiosulfate sulfurtransferase RDL2 [Colletotrichum trifolii]